MKMRNLNDVRSFEQVIDSCKGDVWMLDGKGSRYDMKDKETQFIVMAELLKNEDNSLELFAALKEDEYKLLGFLAGLHSYKAA